MHTHIPTGAVNAEYSAEWLYDQLMENIEPDLMLKNIPLLQERYKGESEQDKQARLGRYEMAFMVLDDCVQDIATDLKLNGILLNAVQSWQSAQEDSHILQDIEHDIDSTSAS